MNALLEKTLTREAPMLSHLESWEFDRKSVGEFIKRNELTTYYQPVYSATDGSIFGYESVPRFQNEKQDIGIEGVFGKAAFSETIPFFDMLCRKNTLKNAYLQNFSGRDSHLFMSICPQSILSQGYRKGMTDRLVKEYGFAKERLVLVITAKQAVYNWDLFKVAIDHYRNNGYRIAINDFASGYGGLKMLSLIEPDFIKIDSHFINRIDQQLLKQNLVDSITTCCHRLGIRVIAEGIGNNAELKVVRELGVEFLQGDYLGKAEQFFDDRLSDDLLEEISLTGRNSERNAERRLAGDIAFKAPSVAPEDSITTPFFRFINDKNLRGLAVIDDERIVGVLHRYTFLETKVLGPCGYGMSLNSFKKVKDMMEAPSVIVEFDLPIEDVAVRIQSRKSELQFHDICVTKKGKYYGMVSINILLETLTERTILFAKGANPLSGLPGNEFIHREIEKRLSADSQFDVCYIDIDNFKPYNDYYGFEKGDLVITSLAKVLEETVAFFNSSHSFVGHIGGDDFILLTTPQVSWEVSERCLKEFSKLLPRFYGAKELHEGCYRAQNRKGEMETFNLLSISIGIVSTRQKRISSYAELSSLASEVKKAAKKIPGNSIFMDRRNSSESRNYADKTGGGEG